MGLISRVRGRFGAAFSSSASRSNNNHPDLATLVHADMEAQKAARGFKGRGVWGFSMMKRKQLHQEAQDKIDHMATRDVVEELRRGSQAVQVATKAATQQAAKLHAAEDASNESLREIDGLGDEMHEYLLDMEADLELRSHDVAWARSVEGFVRDAFGRAEPPADDGEFAMSRRSRRGSTDEEVVDVSPLSLAPKLTARLHEAEPTCPPTCAVVLFHPSCRGVLKVFDADDNSECHPGEVFRPTDHSAVGTDIWAVIHSGEPILRNPHGRTDKATKVRSVFPLREADGRTFGAVVSSPPALPDELLSRYMCIAGELFERAWKMHMVTQALDTAKTLLLQLARDQHALVYVSWQPGKTLKFKRDAANKWKWEPLMFTPPDKERCFQVELRWRRNALGRSREQPIGVWTIDLAGCTKMDEHLIATLHTLGPMVQKCVEDIERSHVGDPAPFASLAGAQDAFNQIKMLLPSKMQAETRQALAHFNADAVFNEIHSYTKPDPFVTKVLRSILVLLGHPRKELKTWEQMKPLMTVDLIQEMLALDLLADTGTMRKRWAESMRVTEEGGITADNDAMSHMTEPVHLLFKWLETTRMVHHVAITAHDDHIKEQQEAQQKHDEHHAKAAAATENSSGKSSGKDHASHGDKNDHHKDTHTKHAAKGHKAGGGSGSHAKGNKASRGPPTFLAPTFAQQAKHAKLKNEANAYDDEIEVGESTLSELLSKYNRREVRAQDRGSQPTSPRLAIPDKGETS